MRIGNCYIFALRERRRRGGWIIVRKSVKTWVPHMQYTQSAATVWGMERVPFREGFRRLYGPERGYILSMGNGWHWAPSIEQCVIEEYLPPEWVNRAVRQYRVAQLFPVMAILFRGYVRRGVGEDDRTRRAVSAKTF
jgi:hypothetical protein